MINNRADYRFVAGDINRVAIDGGIMPARRVSAKKILRGEDLCFLAEAHEARANLWNNATFKMSGETYNDDTSDVIVSSPGQVFNFTRSLSITQLRNLATMHEVDSARRPGAGGPRVCNPFFLKRKPQEVTGVLNQTTLDAITAQLDGMIQDAPLSMPAASLNGRVLKQSEIADMFIDNSRFRLYGCGNTDLGHGYGIGSGADTAYTRVGDTSTLPYYAKHCIYHDVWRQTGTVIQEAIPTINFVFSRFIDDGDVQAAEYWGVYILELENPTGTGIQRWVTLRKIANYNLANGIWKTNTNPRAFRSAMRSMWLNVANFTVVTQASQITNAGGNAFVYLYCPFAIVTPKNRFVW